MVQARSVKAEMQAAMDRELYGDLLEIDPITGEPINQGDALTQMRKAQEAASCRPSSPSSSSRPQTAPEEAERGAALVRNLSDRGLGLPTVMPEKAAAEKPQSAGAQRSPPSKFGLKKAVVKKMGQEGAWVARGSGKAPLAPNPMCVFNISEPRRGSLPGRRHCPLRPATTPIISFSFGNVFIPTPDFLFL